MRTRHDAPRSSCPALRLESVSKVYRTGPAAVTALHELSVAIPAGSFTAVMGPSGSGKSTLLHCAAGLDRPTSGSVFLGPDGDLGRMSEAELTRLRRDRVGFVFQAFNLLPALTVRQNVTLPLMLAGRRPDRGALADVLARVGLADRAGHRPSQLSGGQQQRVAIARALITRPEVVFADEPTGALDMGTAHAVLGLLREAVHGLGQSVLMVTHDPVAASYADTVLFMSDGRIEDVAQGLTAMQVADRVTLLGTRPGLPA